MTICSCLQAITTSKKNTQETRDKRQLKAIHLETSQDKIIAEWILNSAAHDVPVVGSLWNLIIYCD